MAFNRERTIEHFKKWDAIANVYGVKLTPGFMNISKEKWHKLAEADCHLNNVPLSRWDGLALCLKRPLSTEQIERLKELGVAGWALYLGACVYKTAVYRDILGMDAEQYADFKEQAYEKGAY